MSLAASEARAGDVGPGGACAEFAASCQQVDVDYWWDNAVFDDIDLDTGWVPSGADIQVRFGVRLLGRTQVGLGAAVTGHWPEAVTVAVPGRADTGWLSIGYGVELIAKLKIDVVVLGVPYFWEGDIPLPGGIPNDLLMADDAVFDPFAYASGASPIVVSDVIDRISVFTFDITGGVISIPGIDGVFSVEAEAGLEASYQTDRIDVTHARTDALDADSASIEVAPGSDGDYGAGLDLSVQPLGTVAYTGTLTLYPHLEISILGVEVINEDLFAIPIAIPLVDQAIDFDAADVRVSLPDVAWGPDEVAIEREPDIGVFVSFFNEGESTLAITPVDWPPWLAQPAPTSIAPSTTDRLPVQLAADVEPPAGDQRVTLQFATNDPDTPFVEVTATLDDPSTDDPADPTDPGGPGDVGGCGCRSAGGNGDATWLLVLVVGLVLGRRRRGHASRSV